MRGMKIETIAVFQESTVPCFCVKARHVKRLRAAFPRAEVVWCRKKNAFVKVLPQMQVALTWAFRQEWFAKAPRLRRLATPAAGRDFFPVEPPPQVTVRYGTHHGPIMAETVVGMMLAFERGLLEACRCQVQGQLWPRPQVYDARLIAGSHAVIVGFGHIGQKIGEMLKPFGVRVTGVRRQVPEARPAWFDAGDAVVAAGKLDAVLPKADHLILVLPSDEGTDGLIGTARLRRLPRHAVVYNVGRGNCIDEAALAEALAARRVRGACLDVFAQEPLTEASPLAADLPGLFRLPHASAFSEAYIDRFIDDVIVWLKNERGEGRD